MSARHTKHQRLSRGAALAAAVALASLQACVNAGPVEVQYVRDAGDAPSDAYGGDASGASLLLGDGGLVSGRLDLFSGTARFPSGVLDPLGMSTYMVGGSLQGQVHLGERAVVGAVDYRLDRSLLDGAPNRLSHHVIVGPRISFTPGSTTELYYRHTQAESADGSAALFDADSFGAGLAQTWHFADHRGRVRVEYGVHESRDADVPMRAEGQALNLSGIVPLRWGIHATFEADYRTNAYADYPGAADLESSTTAFRAGLRARVGERLHAGVNFSYADEEFESDVLPNRRSAWGINFRFEP
jgi:hypothetical protein